MAEDTRTEDEKLIHFVNVLNESHSRLAVTGDEVDALVIAWNDGVDPRDIQQMIMNLQANVHGRKEAQKHDAEALK